MADIWFDVDTALSEVPINLMPLIDDTDFKSREVALTYNQAGLDLVWNFITTGGTMSQTAVTPTAPGGAYDWQHIGDGMYTIEIPASGGASINNNTEGFGWFTGVATGVLPWRSPIFGFRAAAINNSLIDGATVDVNVTALADDVITAAKFDESTAFPLKSADTGSTQVARVGADSDTLKTLSDEIAAVKTETAAILVDTGTTLDGLIKDVPTVSEFNARTKPAADYFDPATDAVATVTNLTNLPAMPADWLTAAGVKADAVTKIQNGLATPTNITAGTITTATNLTNLPTMPADWVTASGLKADAVAEIQNGLAKAADLQDVENKVDTIDTVADGIATTLASPDNFKADVSGLAQQTSVDDLETRLTAARAGYLDKLNVAGTLANSSDANTYKANVSGLAPANEYDTELAAIQADLDNPNQYKADVSGLALEATLTAMKGAGWTDETLIAIKSAVDALSSGGVDPTVIAAAVLDALLADHTVEGSIAEAIANILEDTGVTLNSLIAAIKAKTDLMNASAITYTPNVEGTTITLLRGDTFTASIADAGALTDYVSIDFTVKASKSDPDDAAIIRVRKNASGIGDGLLRLNGAVPTTETGSITIDDEATGDITITLDETATDDLSTGSYSYDIQLITATTVKTLTYGKLTVISDVTRAVV